MRLAKQNGCQNSSACLLGTLTYILPVLFGLALCKRVQTTELRGENAGGKKFWKSINGDFLKIYGGCLHFNVAR